MSDPADAQSRDHFQGLTEEVLARIATQDSRFRQVMESLIRHLHAFVRDVAPSHEEWRAGIEFLTRTGQMCSQDRQEFILLSDILGVSMLVDAVNGASGEGITDSTVLGPFYTGPQREIVHGESILLREEPAEALAMTGQVRDRSGAPVAGALVEVWQASANQLYDVQDEGQPEGHLRASMRTDAAGGFAFRTVMPVSYPIPNDGPAGQLLDRMGRHPYRPAHVHFMISAPGYRTLVTHLFVDGDEYLHSDPVFGVKPSLIVRPEAVGGVKTIRYDFGLAPIRPGPAP